MIVPIRLVVMSSMAVGGKTVPLIFVVQKGRQNVRQLKGVVSVSRKDIVQIVIIIPVKPVRHQKERRYVRMLKEIVNVYRKDIVQIVIAISVLYVHRRREGQYVILEIVGVNRLTT